MTESWKHKVIREGLEDGMSVPRISKETHLSITSIMGEIENDINLKIMIL